MPQSTVTGDTGNTTVVTFNGEGNPLPPGKYAVTGGGPISSFDIGNDLGGGLWLWTNNAIQYSLAVDGANWKISRVTAPAAFLYIGPAFDEDPIGVYQPITGSGNALTVTNYRGTHFSVAGFAIRSVDQAEESVGRIDTSVLGTTVHRTFIMEDLPDTPELTIEFLWDTFANLNLGLGGSSNTAVGKSLGTVTITYPLRKDETTPATRAGTAQVAAFKQPMLANNELQLGTMRIQFLGSPTFTPST